MADLPDHPARAPDDAIPERVRGSPPGTPRWVKVFGIVAISVALLFVLLLLTRGSHGPHRHLRRVGAPGMAAPSRRP